MDIETKKSRNGSVSRTEYERSKVGIQANASEKTGAQLRSMTMMAREEDEAPASDAMRETKQSYEENAPTPNPQFVESYQADIFDFCMKTEVNSKNVDFFGAIFGNARI